MTNQMKPAKLNKGEKFEMLIKQVKNLSMAVRLNQLLMQKLSQQIGEVANMATTNSNMLNDFQYRMLAVQKTLSIDVDALQKISDELKLNDFNQASELQDADGTWDVIDVVADENDVVIITSITPLEAEDKGILRSRISLAEMQQPELQAKIIGAKVGDTVIHTLNGAEHHITILAARRKKVVAEATPSEKTA